MKAVFTILFLLTALIAIMLSCGEKIDLPMEVPFEGELGDTLYLQLNPIWDAEHGYDFNNPQAVYFGKDTYLYVADTGNDRILRMDAAGTIHAAIPIVNPISVSQDELMRLLVVTGDQKVYKIDVGPSGDMLPYVAYDYTAVCDTCYDHDLLDPDDIFVSITDATLGLKTYFVAVRSSVTGGNGRILWFKGSVDPDTADILLPSEFTNAESDTFHNPVVETGNGILTTNFTNHIYAYEQSGAMHLIVCQDSGSYPVHDMVFIRQVWDNTWVFDYSHYPGEVDILDINLYDFPVGAATDPEGNIYVVDGGLSRNCGGFKFSRAGMLLETFCEPDSLDNVFLKPSSITYDYFGNRKTVFIADSEKNAILRFKLSTDLE